MKPINKSITQNLIKQRGKLERLEYLIEKRVGQIDNAHAIIADYKLEKVYLDAVKIYLETQIKIGESNMSDSGKAKLVPLVMEMNKQQNEAEAGWQMDDLSRANAGFLATRKASKTIIERINAVTEGVKEELA